jgi:uncharacterized protein YfaS (alpha-2-macroglobulin family)/tetratricopeptide (TPR) repeat protein
MMRKGIYGLSLLGVLLMVMTVLPSVVMPQADSPAVWEEAQQLWEEHSYEMAIPKYNHLLREANLSPEKEVEVKFKLADCLWRSGRPERVEKAVDLFNEILKTPNPNRWWAEALVSQAEMRLQQDRWTHAAAIQEHLMKAREYWAASTDTERAREKFIQVSFMLGDFLTQNYGWGYAGITPCRPQEKIAYIPGTQTYGLNVIYEEILQVAESDEDKGRAHYALAMSLMNYAYDQESQEKVIRHFEEVFEHYSTSEWMDDAYYQLGQFMERYQRFPQAVDAYKGLLSRFVKGESAWVDDVHRRLQEITEPRLQVSVPYTFLPGSEAQFHLQWRNLHRAAFTLYQLDMVNALQLDLQKSHTDSRRGSRYYQEVLQKLVESGRYQSLPVVKSWSRDLKDEGTFQWYSEGQGLSEWLRKGDEALVAQSGVLVPGAYLLLVTAGKVKTYELILVSDMALVNKTAGHSALFFTFDGKTGAPRPGVQMKYQYTYYDAQGYTIWEEGAGITNAQGILQVRLNAASRSQSGQQNYHQIIAVASDGTMQAFTQGNSSSYGSGKGEWWLYAFSDRPAYRPEEQIGFKGILRRYSGQDLMNTSGMRIKGRIYDPQGNIVSEQVYRLNPYGSFEGILTLDDKAPLGEYHLEIQTEDGAAHLGRAALFRLEEYKLPEFQVDIRPQPREGAGGAAAYRLGDTVEVEVEARYYFGAPVVHAEVEYLIYQGYYAHSYSPPKPYPWYYDTSNQQAYYGYQDQLIKQEKIMTDEHGRAVFQIATPKDASHDLQYRIEARVVDPSRREIVMTQRFKVTRQAFYAYLTPKQTLYRPGDKARVDIKTLTANDAPIAVEGKLTVSRHWWQQPVIREDRPAQEGHYQPNQLLTKFVTTDQEGDAVFEFEPAEDGYYILQYEGFDDQGATITASAQLFVCDKQSRDIGYQYSGIQIIPEKDTYAVGETARVLLVADEPNRWILWSAAADEIHDHQLIAMEGMVKLLEIPIRADYTPNIYFNALAGRDYQLQVYQVPIVVPPHRQFLNVRIITDQETYRPGEEGRITVELTDQDDHPVKGEIALGMVDKSVFYIQSDYAGDIRKFFYGDKRRLSVETQASFYQRPYVRLVREGDQLITETERRNRELLKQTDGKGVIGGAGGMKGESITGGKEDKDMRFGEILPASLVAAASPAFEGDAQMKEKRVDSPADSFAPAKIADMERNLLEVNEKKSPGQSLAQPKVRSDFRSTVIWQPAIITDENGRAQVSVIFPDSLTTWSATARAVGEGTRVGNITHETRTTKDIIVRLQAPRFFTERDEVTLSTNVHNYTQQEQKIRVTLEVAAGMVLKDQAVVWVTVPAAGEQRVDWRAVAQAVPASGMAEIAVTAQTEDDGDAMRRSYPVIPHGIEKFIAQSAVLKGSVSEPEQRAEFTMELPKERVKEATSLEFVLSPSLAAALLDALPYLAEYPYGCVEQTMSRFLPTVIVAKTMQDLGLSEELVLGYIADVLEPRGDPEGHPQRSHDLTLKKIQDMSREGLQRLYDFQHADGGWGWWKEDDSNRFMTAYVLWGMALARDAGIDVRSRVMEQAAKFLEEQLVEEEKNPDMLAWMLHALYRAGFFSRLSYQQTSHLWIMRDQLNPYTQALFALSQYDLGKHDPQFSKRAEILARNLANGIELDMENRSAHWGEAGVNDRWSEGGVEATAFALKALANIDPQSGYLDPAVKWLALNRRGARWKNTRDTAIAVLALTDYLRVVKELDPYYSYEIVLNGKSIRQGHVEAGNLFTFDRIFELPDEALKEGVNAVTVRIKGRGALYVSAYLKYFTLEEGITPAGHEVFVSRQYFKETPKETLMKGLVSEWTVLDDGDEIHSGERVRVDITLEAKNHYEYLIVEDWKPAGFETVDLHSGTVYFQAIRPDDQESPATTWSYREFRDQKAAFFITKLPQGRHRISYTLRAETPGVFHGMPNQVHAMYVPEIRANSAEMRVTVMERKSME